MLPSPSDPIFLEIGPFVIHWYGLIVTSGLMLGLYCGERFASYCGISQKLFGHLAVASIIGGIIGARLYYVFVLNWRYFQLHMDEVFRIWDGGIAIHGALIGGLLGLFAMKLWHRFSIQDFLDSIAPGLLIAQGIGRWGNYFNQEAFGMKTDAPWCIRIDQFGTCHHPTFFYESVLNLFFGGVLYWLVRRGVLPRGGAIALYLIYYGVARALIEPLRMDSSYFLGMKIAFAVSLVSICVGIVYFLHAFYQDK